MPAIYIAESVRKEEPIGTEQRRIDNSKGATIMTRHFTVIREWSHAYNLENVNAKKGGGTLSVGASEAVKYKITAESNIKKTYSIEDKKVITFKDEIIMTAPPKTKLLVLIHWKHIWQTGSVRFHHDDSNEVDVLFKVLVGVAFDQEQIEEQQ
jgi:hypothetical protein